MIEESCRIVSADGDFDFEKASPVYAAHLAAIIAATQALVERMDSPFEDIEEFLQEAIWVDSVTRHKSTLIVRPVPKKSKERIEFNLDVMKVELEELAEMERCFGDESDDHLDFMSDTEDDFE